MEGFLSCDLALMISSEVVLETAMPWICGLVVKWTSTMRAFRWVAFMMFQSDRGVVFSGMAVPSLMMMRDLSGMGGGGVGRQDCRRSGFWLVVVVPFAL